jgi:tetratricopeptide (TPR) repeat protein
MKAVALILIASCAAAIAQTPLPARELPYAIAIRYTPRHGGVPEDKGDPGYTLYREGYSLILEEKWEAARKIFDELKAKYPKSDYIDDASYWTAYSYRYTDPPKAIRAYESFIEANPGSSYYDDALSDLENLRAQSYHTKAGATARAHGAPSVVSSGTAGAPALAHTPYPPVSLGVAVAAPMRVMERQLRRQMRTLSRVGLEHMAPTAVFPMPREENLDPATRLKMDALYALGETHEDEKSFVMLKEIATDMQQPRPLREAAMDALTSFAKYDVLSVFVEIARKDTNREIQGYAIDFIGEHGSDKNQRVTVLSELYRSLPRGRMDQRQGIIYTIADVGNDRAVDFLKTVALGDENYDLRRDAVYYLGSIGGDKARSALHEILRGK